MQIDYKFIYPAIITIHSTSEISVWIKYNREESYISYLFMRVCVLFVE